MPGPGARELQGGSAAPFMDLWAGEGGRRQGKGWVRMDGIMAGNAVPTPALRVSTESLKRASGLLSAPALSLSCLRTSEH